MSDNFNNIEINSNNNSDHNNTNLDPNFKFNYPMICTDMINPLNYNEMKFRKYGR